MPLSEPWKRYLEAGLELTQVTRARADKIVRDLVKAGELQAQEAGERVEELLERSRRTSESIAERVRDEVQQQLQNLGLVQPVKPAPKPTPAKPVEKATKPPAAKTAKTAKKATTAAKKSTTAAKKATGKS